MLLRYVKISLALSVALWGVISGTMNLVYYSLYPISTVMTVEGQDSLRAISSPIMFTLGFAFIYLGKYAVGILAALGTLKLWAARKNPVTFNGAKSRILAGCGVGIATFFFGFFVMADGVFDAGPPSEFSIKYLSHAAYYIGAIGMVALFIAVPDSDTE